MTNPLMIDLYCGLGGWSDGGIAEGYDVIGFDIERHAYGDQKYPGQLVIQDVTTLHGSQFKDAALIVASPPCQEFSYMAMPWSRAKQIRRALRGNGEFPEGYTGSRTLAELTALFDACFRIQREASAARGGGRIPMVVENVRGAQEWVGRGRWNFGSFYLWGDLPALMPPAFKASKVPSFRFDGSGKSFQTAAVQETGIKAPGMNWSDQSKRGQDFTRLAGHHATGRSPAPGSGARFTSRDCGVEASGVKNGNDWFGSGENCSLQRKAASGSGARKAASAMIAKIPEPLARHIARTFRP